MAQQTLTLVIHGTYAQDADWWRLGDGEPTFADRLEGLLKAGGLSGSVWRPALDNGFDYEAFRWSGRNRHRDRVKAARKLGKSLNRLADRVAATPDQPLVVNFVAHSHGGNVVLEALRHLGENVRTGRIVLLGTPLITVQPALRIARFLLSTAWLWLFAVAVILILTGLVAGAGRLVWGPPSFLKEFPLKVLFGLPPVLLFGYGLVFYLLGNMLDALWRAVARVAQPLGALRNKSWSRVYGPSDAGLASTLGGRPIVFFGARKDEADLLLRITSAPAVLYKEYVLPRCPWWARPFEWVLLRPFVDGVALGNLEMALEVAVLGVSPWRALFFDFDLAPPAGLSPQSAPLFVTEHVVVPPRAARPLDPRAPAEDPDGAVQLATTLAEVAAEVRRQIHLRHTAYYDNEALVERVAQYLNSGELATTARESDAARAWRTPRFWELLTAANVGLAALLSLVLPPLELSSRWGLGAGLGLLGYVVPFACLGLTSVASSLARRRPLRQTSRWFWIWWGFWAVLAGWTIIAARGVA